MDNLVAMPARFDILIVDDSPTELRIMQEALTDARMTNRLHTAQGGFEAMAFLRKEGPFAAAPRPSLILLDLTMGPKGGLAVLAEIKADPALCSIPTIIVTSSLEESDVAKAYRLQANGYIVKPIDLDDLIEVMGGLEEYWSGIVRLPALATP